VGDLVAVVLDVGQPIADRLHVHTGQRQLVEQLGAAHEVLGRSGEQLVERALGGTEGELHGGNLYRRTASFTGNFKEPLLCTAARLPGFTAQ
jgi:hypothetical protein